MRRPPLLCRVFATLLLPCSIAACGEHARSETATPDVVTIATPADADALLPPLIQTTQGKQVADLLFDHLAAPSAPLVTIGDAGFRPQLAARWMWAADSLSIAFALRPDARWHDGVPVRASDVAFSWALYVDSKVASPHAHAFDGIDSVTVRDSLTAVAWWSARHPEQFFQLAYNLAVLPAHLLRDVPRDSLALTAFASHPVGSGRYRFTHWTPHRDLLITADSANYRGRPGFSRVLWVVTADPTAANLSVLSGSADVVEQLRADAFTQVGASSTVRAIEYGSFDYAYLQFNLRRSIAGQPTLFAERALRRALTAAVDRPAVVRNALDSLGAVALGPFTRADASADTLMPQIRFDTVAASHTLDSLGWRIDPRDGLRRRAGEVLAFEILLPATSATRARVAVLLQSQYRSIGVSVTVTPLEPAVFYDRLEHGQFDTALNMWRAEPSPTSVAQVWGTVKGANVGMNFGRYSNVAFDAMVDSAARAFDPTVRRRLMRNAYQRIVDDAPAVWLYEPRNFVAISARIAPTGMRADAWWAELADWQVAPRAVASKANRPQAVATRTP